MKPVEGLNLKELAKTTPDGSARVITDWIEDLKIRHANAVEVANAARKYAEQQSKRVQELAAQINAVEEGDWSVLPSDLLSQNRLMGFVGIMVDDGPL